MEQSVIVVDGAYGEPEEIRRTALSLAYGDAPGAFVYPGRISHAPPTEDELRCVATAVVSDRPAGDGAGSDGAFHLSMAVDGDGLGVHSHDPDCYRWIGIIDLTPPTHEPGAISFYRHIETGSEGLCGEAARDRRAIADAPDPGRWERVMSVSTAFNRLVVFRPWLWHSVPTPRGTAAHDARLMRILMVETAAAEHAAGPAMGLRAG